LVILTKKHRFLGTWRDFTALWNSTWLIALAIGVFTLLTAARPCLAEPTHLAPAKDNRAAQFVAKPVAPKLARHLSERIGVLRAKIGAPFCTAFCLAPTLIATAGHCLRSGKDARQPDRSSLTFERVSQDPRATHSAETTHTSPIAGLVSGGIPVSFRKPIEADRDWAVLRLQTPVCTHGGLKMASGRTSLRQASTPKALVAPRIQFSKHRLATLRAKTCQRLNVRSNDDSEQLSADFSAPNLLMFHDCDAGPIASGSPLLQKTDAGFEVVALHVGSYVRSRFIEHNHGLVQRMASKPVANIAVRVEEFTRPVRDLLRPGKRTRTARPGHGPQRDEIQRSSRQPVR